jgi:hypothetical protein
VSFLPDLKAIGYAILAALIALPIALWWGHHQFDAGEKAELELGKTVQLTTTIKADALQADISQTLVPELIYVQGATTTLIHKVPVYVTKTDDSKCTINNGFVSVWNAANQMQPTTASTIGVEQPSGVVLSDVAAQHAKEAGVCTATEKQRDALEEYILGLQKIYSSK